MKKATAEQRWKLAAQVIVAELETAVASMSPRSAVSTLQTEVSSLRDMLEGERASSTGVIEDMKAELQSEMKAHSELKDAQGALMVEHKESEDAAASRLQQSESEGSPG